MRNTGVVRKGDMLLIDAGVEVNSLYTTDITRTFPTNGKFTDFQRRLYQAVLDSQQAGFEAAKPGATYSDIHHACMRVIAQRLHDWGLLPVDVEESLSPEGQQHRRWLACGVAHHLGLDVHDCAVPLRVVPRREDRAWHDLSPSSPACTSARTTC